MIDFMLGLTLLSSAPNDAPRPPPPVVVGPILLPALSDIETWALARASHSRPAYETYLRRFPNGAFHGDASDVLDRLDRDNGAAPTAPTAKAAAAPLPPVIVGTLCLTRREMPGSPATPAETQAFTSAFRSNREADYGAYLDRFPNGVCALQARTVIKARQARRALLGPIMRFGPMAAHVLQRNVITSDDYPLAALRAGEAGRVAVEWVVAEDGVPEDCRVVRSSGSAVLDAETCGMITRRLRYDPARNASGRPVRMIDERSVVWQLEPEPADEPPSASPAPN